MHQIKSVQAVQHNQDDPNKLAGYLLADMDQQQSRGKHIVITTFFYRYILYTDPMPSLAL